MIKVTCKELTKKIITHINKLEYNYNSMKENLFNLGEIL